MVGFFEVLNSANSQFSVFSRFYFHEWVCQKLSNAMDGLFFEGLNFTDDQHPRNSRNLCTSKKPTIRYNYVIEEHTCMKLISNNFVA